MRCEKIRYQCPNAEKKNLIVIYRFSLKAAMNAFVNCAMALTKRINFFFFQWPKAGQRPKRTCQLHRD
jgi:hypothetical protein